MAIIAFDVETNARDPRHDPDFRVLGVSYARDDGLSGYINLGHGRKLDVPSPVGMRTLRSHVGSASTFVFHNAKFDLVCFERLDIPLWDKDWFCTMLMTHCLDENLPNKGLDYLGKLYFNEGKEKSEEFENFLKCFGWAFLPEWMIRDYAIQDAKLTLKIFFKHLPRFIKEGYASPTMGVVDSSS